jgi:hypothetical protein
MGPKKRILSAVRKGIAMTTPKHPEIRITLSDNWNSVTLLGNVARRLRQAGHYNTIEEFMSKALLAETDDEFIAILKRFIRVNNG